MVKAWREKVVIPTYECGAPEKNPIFLENRVYQGSSGVVYPYPVIESIADEKQDKTYDAVFLENEYLKIMILPELGGRVQMAFDKIKQRHFIYYNQVIKPALVGLAGPWISGGIEFNWPQHHRPSTFMPVDSCIEEHPDGSVTVWVSERERMFHQKGMGGFTLRPGCAYLEIKGVLYNPTPMPQTFLWWANPAVKVNEHYQSVFPQDVNAVFDHGKRAVSSFPIAMGTYYKVDYSAGVDISNYRNIPVPTSYMAVNSKYDFEGGYENDTQAGMLHVASHHVSPGKKQWTWGNGDFGQAWDRNLTDEDGPYIELMAGVFTENQPDFSWLMPYEEKEFTQYFLPYRELGVVKNATKDVLMNLEDGVLKVFATSRMTVRIVVGAFDKTVELSPETVFEEIVGNGEELDSGGKSGEVGKVEIFRLDGRRLLAWEPEPADVHPIPDAAEAALRPEEIKTNEQLYLTGLHLEQYRHATFCALDYYEEALRRDPDDVRCNNSVGLWFVRRGRFAKAEPYLRRAVKILQKRNPNPYDGEPFFNLGLCLKFMAAERNGCESEALLSEAYDWFYKSTWNAAWQDAGFLACARISTMQGRYEDALLEVERSLVRNWHNHQARVLKTYLLNIIGKKEVAKKLTEESLAIDRFNFGCLFELEKISSTEDQKTLTSIPALTSQLRGDANDYDQLALDYCAFGAYEEAAKIWQMAIVENAVTPMTRYYLAWAESRNGEIEDRRIVELFEEAASVAPDFCFPNRLEAILALERAMEMNETDAHAPYFLGNLYYDKRQYDLAIAFWEKSAALDDSFPIVLRNLALAAFNKQDDKEKAVELMERAFLLDETDARVLMELDQLYKRLCHPHDERLAFLQKYPELVAKRDDLLLEEIALLNLTGNYEEAMKKLDAHQFHPWEGGEGKVPAQYQLSRVEMAKRILFPNSPSDEDNSQSPTPNSQVNQAITWLEQCLSYPNHLGEGKLQGALDNDFLYLLGFAHTKLGEDEKARECWQKGTVAPMEPAAALYYNDAAPDKLFYAAMCERALGLLEKKNGNAEEACTHENRARSRFNRLIAYGAQHLFDDIKPDYFAVSLPDLLVWDGSLNETNRVHCLYMLALGHFGLGNKEKSQLYLDEAATMNPNHLGIFAFRSFVRIL